jgi:hypothetical protein
MNTYDEFPDVPAYLMDGVESEDTPDPDIEDVVEELHKDDDLPSGVPSGDDDDLVEDTSDEEEELIDEEDEPELDEEEEEEDDEEDEDSSAEN